MFQVTKVIIDSFHSIFFFLNKKVSLDNKRASCIVNLEYHLVNFAIFAFYCGHLSLIHFEGVHNNAIA